MGYRLVDTAAIYGNEEDVGRAIKDSGVPRDQVYVITKLWDTEHGYDRTLAALPASLAKLGLDYVDLYLMHSPNTGKLVETWDAMVELKQLGLARSVCEASEANALGGPVLVCVALARHFYVGWNDFCQETSVFTLVFVCGRMVVTGLASSA